MKKLLASIAIAIGLLAASSALVLGLGSLRWHPIRQAGAPLLESVARGAGPLFAGSAQVQLRLQDPPMAGFARMRWSAKGWRDEASIRAIALREQGCTVVLLSAELLLVPEEMRRAVERAVSDLRLDGLVIGATHTHAGPGGYWDHPIAARLATGPFDRRIFDAIVHSMAEATRQAVAALTPATLSIGRGEARALARNRNGGRVDGRLVSIRLSNRGGAPLGQLVLFPAHPTLLGMKNRRLSGDWPGALMRATPVPTLFFQGALGDQSALLPSTRGAPDLSPERYAAALRTHLDALPHTPPDRAPPLALAASAVPLPDPTLSAVPLILRPLARTLCFGLFPARARVTALQLGSLTLLAVPGEPVADVAQRWRAWAGDESEVLALADAYLGYVETPERTQAGTGEAVRTYYGPSLALRLEDALRLAVEALRAPNNTPRLDHGAPPRRP